MQPPGGPGQWTNYGGQVRQLCAQTSGSARQDGDGRPIETSSMRLLFRSTSSPVRVRVGARSLCNPNLDISMAAVGSRQQAHQVRDHAVVWRTSQRSALRLP